MVLFSFCDTLQVYIIWNIILVAALTFLGEQLTDWMPQYSMQQLVQIRIIMNLCRAGFGGVLFLAFPLLKFRYSFGGHVFDTNLFNEASFIPKKEKKITTTEQMEESAVDANGNIDLHKQTKNMFHNVDVESYPSLLGFLSRNNKCYEIFKKHLADCLAVENLLFFTRGLIYDNII